MPDTPDTVIDLLRGMVSFDTVNAGIAATSGHEQRMTDWLALLAQQWGLRTRVLTVPSYVGGDNLLITTPPVDGRPWLLFDSHTDTVATDGMTVDPFAGETRDGKVWGRGTCDTKGSGAAMLWAMKEAVEAGELPNNIALLFSIDEEVGMTGIQAFCEAQLSEIAGDFGEDFRGFRGAIVGEPTLLNPITHHNGVARYDLITRGIAAHSSVPADGANAISALARLIQAIETGYVPTLGPGRVGHATCTVNTIKGGSAANIIPDTCAAVIDRRVVEGEDAAAVVNELQRVLAAVELPAGTSYELVTHIAHPPMAGDADAPWGRQVRSVLDQVGLDSEPQGAAFATHGGFLDRAGIPSVVLGPGDVAQAHRKDEFVDINQLEQAVRVYHAIMRST